MSAVSHWHDDLEFSVALSGHMTFTVNEVTFRVNSGEGVFINARQLHRNFSADGSDCEYLCVLIHPSLFCAAPHLEDEYITPLITNADFLYRILSPETPWQAALIDAVTGIHQAFPRTARCWP